LDKNWEVADDKSISPAIPKVTFIHGYPPNYLSQLSIDGDSRRTIRYLLDFSLACNLQGTLNLKTPVLFIQHNEKINYWE